MSLWIPVTPLGWCRNTPRKQVLARTLSPECRRFHHQGQSGPAPASELACTSTRIWSVPFEALDLDRGCLGLFRQDSADLGNADVRHRLVGQDADHEAHQEGQAHGSTSPPAIATCATVKIVSVAITPPYRSIDEVAVLCSPFGPYGKALARALARAGHAYRGPQSRSVHGTQAGGGRSSTVTSRATT